MQTDTAGIAATELHGDDRQQVIATALAGDLTLAPMQENEPKHVPRGQDRDDVWERTRREVHRDHVADLNSRVTNNLGLWG